MSRLYYLLLLSFEKENEELEIKHCIDKDDVTLQPLNKAKLKLSTQNTQATEIAILKSKQRYVEHGESAGKLLAWQIKDRGREHFIVLWTLMVTLQLILRP